MEMLVWGMVWGRMGGYGVPPVMRVIIWLGEDMILVVGGLGRWCFGVSLCVAIAMLYIFFQRHCLVLRGCVVCRGSLLLHFRLHFLFLHNIYPF